jgi:hypothetical protein
MRAAVILGAEKAPYRQPKKNCRKILGCREKTRLGIRKMTKHKKSILGENFLKCRDEVVTFK